MGCGASKNLTQVAAEPASADRESTKQQQQAGMASVIASGSLDAASPSTASAAEAMKALSNENTSAAAVGNAITSKSTSETSSSSPASSPLSASQPSSATAATSGGSNGSLNREDAKGRIAATGAGSSSQLDKSSESNNVSNPTPLKEGAKEPSGESLSRKPIPAISKPVAFAIDLNETSKVIQANEIRKPELPSKYLEKIDRSEFMTPDILKAKQEAAEKRRLEREREHQERLKGRGDRITKAAQAAKVSSHVRAENRAEEGRPATMEEELALAAAVQRLERVHAGDEAVLYGASHLKQHRARSIEA